MKINYLMLALYISFMSGGCRPSGSEGLPVIETEKDIFDLGRVHSSDSIHFSFKIYNKGADTLKVLKYGGGCGCTNIEIGKTKLLSGDSSTVNVLYLPNEDVDSVYKSIILETNSREPYKVVRLRAFVDTIGN